MSDQLRPGPASGPPAGAEGPIAVQEARRTYGGYGSYGGYPGYGEGEVFGEYGGAAGEIHLLDYLRTLYRRRWIAATTFAVLFIYMAMRTFSETPIYQARVQLQIDPETPNVVPLKGMIDQVNYGYEDYYYQTQYAILRSRGLARRTIDALNLWDRPSTGASPPASTSLGLFGSIRNALGQVKRLFIKPRPGPQVPNAAETARESGTIDGFLGGLTVSPVRNSRLVDVKYTSPDPSRAALLVNTLAKEFIAQDLENKFLSTKEASNWLSDQLAVERQKLEASELALQRYREKGDAVALEDRQNIVVQRLTDLNAAYTEARTVRFEKEALYNQLRRLENDRPALDTFPAILSSSFIQQLKSQLADLQRQQAQMAERLGEKHPEMIKQNLAVQSTEAKLAAEIAKVVASVRTEFLSAQAKEQSLASELQRQKADALSLNRKGIEYGVLRREADSNKQMYDFLMQRAKETGISSELKTSNIRIVDQAEVPRAPISPNTPRGLLLGLVGGLIAGIGLGFFVEYLDNRVKNPDELKQGLGLSFLGLIPEARGPAIDPGHPPLLGGAVPEDFAEAFRVVRTSVLFSSAGEGGRSVVVTSTFPQEGKTVVAANLAIGLAQAGHRVLLIDADMRKPRQHTLLGLSQDPGLSSLLVGRAKAKEAIRGTKVRNLWIIAAGPNPPNPAELLGADRFGDLLKALIRHFDWLVIDSPPVMAVTDSTVIAHRATGVVYVVGCERVSRRAVKSAIEQLTTSRATILGAVLNRVNVSRNPHYYSNYYRRDYSGYYRSEAKEQASG